MIDFRKKKAVVLPMQAWAVRFPAGQFLVQADGGAKSIREGTVIMIVGRGIDDAFLEFENYYGTEVAFGYPSKKSTERRPVRSLYGDGPQPNHTVHAVDFVMDVQRDIGSIRIVSGLFVCDDTYGLKMVRLRAVEGDKTRVARSKMEHWRYDSFPPMIEAMF